MKIRPAKYINDEAKAICFDVIKYNIATVAQVAAASNSSIAKIEGRLKSAKRHDLRYVYPFQSVHGVGPKFIIFNEGCQNFIVDSRRYDK